MNIDEANEALDELMEREGIDEETAAKVLFLMYKDSKLNFEELKILVEILGFELTDDYINLSEEERKAVIGDSLDSIIQEEQ